MKPWPSFKKVLFALASLLLALLVCELFSWCYLSVLQKKPFDWRKYNEERCVEAGLQSAGPAESEQAADWRQRIVFHPYVGFVKKRIDKDVLGFGNADGALHRRSPGKIIIGVTGGSVAGRFARDGSDELMRVLRQYPTFFKDQTIQIVSLALGGYKQPQQFMALSYALAMGAEFDYVVNIDGFNELTLPLAELKPKRINPFFPRNWAKISLFTDQGIILSGRAIRTKMWMKGWSQFFTHSFLRSSAFCNLLWKAGHQTLARVYLSLNLRLAEMEGSSQEDFFNPPYPYSSEGSFFTDAAVVWRECSIQMNRLCEANRIKYFHILQPNQYLPGSKSLSAEELKKAYNVNHPQKYGSSVERGYPYLRKEAEALTSSGVSFSDLTGVFKDHPETLYVDDCCHVNKAGSVILAERVARLIAEGKTKELGG